MAMVLCVLIRPIQKPTRVGVLHVLTYVVCVLNPVDIPVVNIRFIHRGKGLDQFVSGLKGFESFLQMTLYLFS